MGPGPPGAQNVQIVSKDSIKKWPDSEGRRILEFCPLGTRLDLVSFLALLLGLVFVCLAWRVVLQTGLPDHLLCVSSLG